MSRDRAERNVMQLLAISICQLRLGFGLLETWIAVRELKMVCPSFRLPKDVGLRMSMRRFSDRTD
jgi:hypothetical protein